MAKNSKMGNWLIVISAIIGLSFFAYFFRKNSDVIGSFVENNPYLGIFMYLLVGFIDVIIISPGISVPLIPVAGRIWGSLPAALMIIGAWTAGSSLAFILVRIYGLDFAEKFIDIKKLKEFKKQITKGIFYKIVLIRLVFPTDVVSYALGLFTDISFKEYISASVIGISPGAFVLAYAGRLPFYFEIMTYIIGAILFVWLAYYVRKFLKISLK